MLARLLKKRQGIEIQLGRIGSKAAVGLEVQFAELGGLTQTPNVEKHYVVPSKFVNAFLTTK